MPRPPTTFQVHEAKYPLGYVDFVSGCMYNISNYQTITIEDKVTLQEIHTDTDCTAFNGI